MGNTDPPEIPFGGFFIQLEYPAGALTHFSKWHPKHLCLCDLRWDNPCPSGFLLAREHLGSQRPLACSHAASLWGPDVVPKCPHTLPQHLLGPPRPSPRWPIRLSSFTACFIPPRGSTFVLNQRSVFSCDFITRQEMATKASPALGMGPLPSGRRILEIPETVKHLGC